MKNACAAFVKAQRNFAPAIKSKVNPHFKNRYADLQTCIEAVIDALHAEGLALMQICHECPDGVTVETLFVHESGESLSGGKLHVPANKQDPQQYGSALTYARRYSLQSAAGFAQEDDDGNAASKKAPPPPKMAPEKVIEFKRSMLEAKTMDALKQVFASAHSTAKALCDQEALDLLKEYYDMRKAEFLEAEAA